jgi:hypothetical protein
MTVCGFLSQARNLAIWFCVAVLVVLAVFLLAGLGTAQTEKHPMQVQGYFVASENLYVAPKQDRVPALVPGQQFICVPDPQQPLVYYDATSGALLPRFDVALKVLTLARIEDKGSTKPGLRFRLEGTDTNVLLFTNEEDVTKLPGLQPLVEDDTLRRLRNKYIGKKAWVYGDGIFRVVGLTKQPNTEAVYYLGNSQSIHIKNLVCIYKKQSFVKLGTTDEGVSADNPLIAVLDLPKNFHWKAAEFDTEGLHQSASFAAQAQASPYSVCLGFLSNHVDDWDFERTFSLTNLYRVHPHWPHEIRIGMTPEMVAWVQGWPPEFGTMAQLKKESKWRYPSVGPFSYWVYFNNGKVVKFGSDGNLP